MNRNLSVNLNDADTICPFCKTLNFSVRTAKCIEKQLLLYPWNEYEEKIMAICIICDNCGKTFCKQHYVKKICSILRLNRVHYEKN